MLASQTQSLAEHDPVIADIIEREAGRQYRGLELIASENLTSRAVMECMGSFLTNKYAEGEVGSRYYGGTEHVDAIEKIAKERALAAFDLDPKLWSVNVQPYSGSPANFAVYTGLLNPHDRIMGLELASGGHLTHGFYTPTKRINASSKYFESFPYKVDDKGVIDYAQMESIAETFRPSMIVLGASAYTKDYDYERVRRLCDKIGAFLFMDMAHTAGLIASKLLKNPFEYADVVTTTTHKSLRGPRAGMIFVKNFKTVVEKSGEKKQVETDWASRINQAVFPGLQGGPHMHQIAAIATQMKEVKTEAFVAYSKQVIANAQRMAAGLKAKGHVCIGDGTENHLLVWHVKKYDESCTGSKVETLLEHISISTNKNTVPGDVSPLNPSGIRLGSGAVTSRGMGLTDVDQVVDFLHRGVELTKKIAASATGKLLKDFKAAMPQHEAEIHALRAEVEAFAAKFGLPGVPEPEKLKYAGGVPPY